MSVISHLLFVVQKKKNRKTLIEIVIYIFRFFEKSKTSKPEDMDDIFRINKPPTTTTKIHSVDEEEDDPFSPSNPRNNSTDGATMNGGTAPVVKKPETLPINSAPTIETTNTTNNTAQTPTSPKINSQSSVLKDHEKMTGLSDAMKKQVCSN